MKLCCIVVSTTGIRKFTSTFDDNKLIILVSILPSGRSLVFSFLQSLFLTECCMKLYWNTPCAFWSWYSPTWNPRPFPIEGAHGTETHWDCYISLELYFPNVGPLVFPQLPITTYTIASYDLYRCSGSILGFPVIRQRKN